MGYSSTSGTYFGKTVTYVSVAQVGTAGTAVLAAADTLNKHKILGVYGTISAAGTLKFTDTAGDRTGASNLAANAGFVLPTSLIPYIETSAINQPLNLVTTGGGFNGIVIIVTEP